MRVNWKEYAPQDIIEAVNSAPRDILGKWEKGHWDDQKTYTRYNCLRAAYCQIFQSEIGKGYHWVVDGPSAYFQWKPGDPWQISGEAKTIKLAKRACDKAARKYGWVLV